MKKVEKMFPLENNRLENLWNGFDLIYNPVYAMHFFAEKKKIAVIACATVLLIQLC